jgi:hypothetical protein
VSIAGSNLLCAPIHAASADGRLARHDGAILMVRRLVGLVGPLACVAAVCSPAAWASSSTPTSVEDAPPVITGTAQQGQALTASLGTWTVTTSTGGSTWTWTGAPDAATFAWEDCDAAGMNYSVIAGATSDVYPLSWSDVGKTVRVEVSGTVESMAVGPAVSAPTPVVTPPPRGVITPPQVVGGNRYSVVPGTWTGDPTTFSYQWLDCTRNDTPTAYLDLHCTPIPGATDMTYTPTAADAAFLIAIEETASNAYGTTTAQSWVDWSYIGPAPGWAGPPLQFAPSSQSGPSITGSSTVGGMLTEAGSWNAGGLAITYAYQWERCRSSACAPISGATAASYVLTGSDLGDTIEVLVTAASAAGSTVASSGQVGPITEPPLETLSPSEITRLRQALATAITPPARVSANRLRRAGWSAPIPALPAGTLTVSWSELKHRTIQLAFVQVHLQGTGGATIHLVLTRHARSLVRSSTGLHVRAEARFNPATGRPLDVVTRFTVTH